MSTIRNPLDLLTSALERPFDVATVALLTVDMQYLGAHPDWGVGREAHKRGIQAEFEYYWEQCRVIIPRIRCLQQACRARRIELVHLRIASATKNCRDSSKGHRLRGLLAPSGSREAEFLEEVAPEDDELVIGKTSSSAFNSTAIDQTLRNLGIEHLIACGVATNACVEMTVRDAADRNYQVTVVHDACAASSESLHQAALLMMSGFMGLVKLQSTDEVLKLLEREPISVHAGRK